MVEDNFKTNKQTNKQTKTPHRTPVWFYTVICSW